MRDFFEKLKEKRKLRREKTFERFKKHPTWVLLIMILGFIVMALSCDPINWMEVQKRPRELDYPTFVKILEMDNVAKVIIDSRNSSFLLTDKQDQKYRVPHPETPEFKISLLNKGIEVSELSLYKDIIKPNKTLFIVALLVLLAIVVAILGCFGFFKGALDFDFDDDDENIDYDSNNSRSTSKTKTKTRNKIKSHFKPEFPDVTLNDIAGNEEAKRDLKHKIHSLIEPELYENVGAILPKGILLTGPPGTGKTLMAKALAGESGVPFFSLSGSDFVEMYVGVGAKRIRNLFAAAEEHGPSIIFIDEIDAIGGARTGRPGESEREQTLNALLVEMNKVEDVIVIAATNRPDMLDDALVRPGRFDSKVTMNNPSKEDRFKIIVKHFENKKISSDVDIRQLVKKTMGFSGAAIASIINEAAISCALNGREILEKQDFDVAYVKTLTKGYQVQEVQDERSKIITAWHEAGHTLCTKLLTNKEITEVSIIPTTSGVGGYTMSHSERENYHTKQDLINEVKVLYAGRAAEEIASKSIQLVTTGASNDIKRATQLIKDCIGIYGLGESGMLDLGQFNKGESRLMDEAVTIAQTLYNETLELLREKENLLKVISNELLENETLSGDDITTIIEKNSFI
ncbi:MAG: AAA family ATPase [Cellulosilyticaceae bacterium]